MPKKQKKWSHKGVNRKIIFDPHAQTSSLKKSLFDKYSLSEKLYIFIKTILATIFLILLTRIIFISIININIFN